MAANKVDSSLQVVLSLNKGQFINSVNQIKGNLASLSKSFQQVSQIAAAFGVGFGGYALAQGFQKVIGTAAEFEQKMKLLQAITDSSDKEMKSLAESALKLGSASLYSANQVAELQTALAKLGFTNSEIKNTTKSVIDLATATGEDLAKSADTVGSTLRGFNLSASESQRVADVMTAAFNRSALGVDNFAEAMKYVAANAAASNVSLEYTTATLGVLADAGLRGSIAGTALRKIFSELPKDGRPLQERMAELAAKGITLTDAFDEVGRTAQTALLLMVNNNDKLNGLADALGNVNGETERTARLVGDTFQGDLKRFGSALEQLYIVSTNTGWFRGIITGLTEFTRAIAGFGPSLAGVTADVGLALKNVERDGRGTDVSYLNGIVDTFRDKFAELRKEAGKPLDLSIADEVGKRFGLTTEAITALRKVLESVNPVLTEQEKIMGGINTFLAENAKQYKSNAEAVEAYRLGIVQLYVENQKQLKLAVDDTSFIGTTGSVVGQAQKEKIAALRAEGEEYRRTIEGITAYYDSLKTGATVTQNDAKDIKDKVEALSVLPGSYQAIVDKINELNKIVKENIDLTVEGSDVKVLKIGQEIEALEALKKKYDDVQKSFKFALASNVTNDGREFDPNSSQRQALTAQTTDGIDSRVLKRMEETTKAFKKLQENSADTVAKVQLSWNQLSGTISSGISDIVFALAMGAEGVGSFGDTVLRAVVNFAKQLGELLIASGTAALVIDSIAISPPLAIAAGIALTAAAGAAAASLNKGISGGGSSTAGRDLGRSSLDRLSSESFGMEIQFNATFVQRGQDLVAVVNSQNSKNGRIKG